MSHRSRVWAGVCGAWLVFGGVSAALAGPAEDSAPAEDAASDPAAAPSEDSTPASDPPASPPVSVSKVRQDMESGMSTLGELASVAKRDSDLVKATCVLDKQERAQGVMELATTEMLVIRDDGSSADAKAFAAEKLQAASQRLGDLVEQARSCAGDQTPEASDDATSNDVDEEPTIPVADPTLGGGLGGAKPPSVPPPVDDGAPPTVGSPTV